MVNRIKNYQRRGRKEKGTVLFLTSLFLLFIIFPAVGLAIDGGVAFAVKSRLQTASDGAALAAARSLADGLTFESQKDSATATAQQFFTANMNRSWARLANPTANVTWPAAPIGTRIVRLDASVDAPTYFMRILGYNSLRVRAAAQANRRDVNIMVVLDRSGSVQNLNACDELRNAAWTFTNSFSEGRDRLGLVTFGTTYRTDFTMGTDFETRNPDTMLELIERIQCVGGTNSAAAYFSAWQQLLAINQPNRLNVIVFFTDGQPNTLTLGRLDILNASPCTSKTQRQGVITPAGTQVWGIFQNVEPAMPARNPDYVPITSNANCSFMQTNSSGNPPRRYWQVINDVNDLSPTGAANEKDLFDNTLTGYKSVSRDGANGRIRIDDWQTVTNAGINAMDSAASRVRALSAANGLNVVTYAIALGGAPAPAEDELMRRIANTRTSPIYDSTKPEGLYIFAENATHLEQAFQRLASEILRISH